MSTALLAETPVQPYTPKAFSTLPLFRDSKSALKKQRANLCPVGSVIVKHGLEEKMGVSLLHKHFPLEDGEILSRSFDTPGRTITMRPVPKQRKSNAVPYLWRAVRESGGKFAYYPLEFVEREYAEELDGFRLDEHLGLLQDMAYELEKYNLLNVFGIATLNITKLRENDDELLVETTDSVTRTLTVKPEPGPVPEDEELTETLWTFGPVNQANEEAACKGTHCAGHCHGHCLGHCVGHCHSHNPHPQ
ncbi:hypothetical protein AB5L52_06720 [Streptomyces sp. CG4]|uniref:hypothetical protein n=1 Tax=Streptomyces sp. CG4 TaxID=408783 RepID=UPI0034E24A0F